MKDLMVLEGVVVLVKLPKMEREEIEELIQQQMLCRIAFKGKNYPYIAPFQYTYMNGTMYFHFTDYGKKMTLLAKDDRVCVEIERFQPDLSEYNFVVLRGRLGIVADSKERAEVIEGMAREGKRKLSANFLAAHGFRKEEGWSSFSSEKRLVIVKLVDIAEEIGIKSRRSRWPIH